MNIRWCGDSKQTTLALGGMWGGGLLVASPKMSSYLREQSLGESSNGLSGFKRIVADSFMPLEISTTAKLSFRGTLSQASNRRVQLTRIEASPHKVERPEPIRESTNSHMVKLNLVLKGAGTLVQDERSAKLGPGDLAVSDAHRPYSISFREDFQLVALLFDTRQLNLSVRQLAQITATTVSPNSGMAAAVSPYLQKLGSNPNLILGTQGEQITSSTLDLVQTVLIEHLGLITEKPNERAELTMKIRHYIDSQLTNPGLSPAIIAKAHFISVRHLHDLFSDENLTVARYIKTQRLNKCRHDLLDPLLAAYPVHAIAARWGFLDAAHFSKVFRTEHGMSPSQFRHGGPIS